MSIYRPLALSMVLAMAIHALAPDGDIASADGTASPMNLFEDVLLPDLRVGDYWEYSTKAWGSGQAQYNSTGTYVSKVEQKGMMNVNGTTIDGYRFSSDSQYYYVSVIQGNLYKSWTNSTGASFSLISTLGSVNASSSTLTKTLYLGNTTTTQSLGYTDYSPPYNYWQFPIKENESWSGTSWANSTTFVNGNRYTASSPISFTLHSASWEEVTVPAGKFRALRIRTEPTNGYFSLMWYAPGAQTTVRTESYDPSATMTGVQELTKFSSSPPDRIPPGIVSISPPAGASGVGLDADLRVRFSEAMDKAAAESALTITGATVVSFVWTGDELDANLAPLSKSTTFQATVAATAVDSAGNALDGDGDGSGGDAYSWSFTTGSGEVPVPPKVVGMSPPDWATGVALNAKISIAFDLAMDQPSVERALSVVPSTPGAFSWSADSRSVSLSPSSLLAPAQDYIVTLVTSARSAAGVYMNAEFNSKFTTGTSADTDSPTVISFTPADARTDVALDTRIVIVFSEPMQISTLDGFVTISPTIDFVASAEATRLTLTPLLPLAAGTTYTIKVGDKALDAAGNPVEPVSARFTTVSKDGGGGGAVGAVGDLLLYGILATIVVVAVAAAALVLVIRRRRRPAYSESDYYRRIGVPPPPPPGPGGRW